MVSTPLKNISQNGNLPQIRGENQKYLKRPPSFRLIRWALSPGVPSWGSLPGSHLWAEAHWPTPAGDRPHGPGQTVSPTHEMTPLGTPSGGRRLKGPELPFESQTKRIHSKIGFPNCHPGVNGCIRYCWFVLSDPTYGCVFQQLYHLI